MKIKIALAILLGFMIGLFFTILLFRPYILDDALTSELTLYTKGITEFLTVDEMSELEGYCHLYSEAFKNAELIQQKLPIESSSLTLDTAVELSLDSINRLSEIQNLALRYDCQ